MYNFPIPNGPASAKQIYRLLVIRQFPVAVTRRFKRFARISFPAERSGAAMNWEMRINYSDLEQLNRI